jgi:hypothetical protein
MILLVGNVNVLFFVLLLILLSLLIYFYCRVSEPEPEPQVIEEFGGAWDWIKGAVQTAGKETGGALKDVVGAVKDVSNDLGVSDWLEAVGEDIKDITYDAGDMMLDVKVLKWAGEGIKDITEKSVDELSSQIDKAMESEVAGLVKEWADKTGLPHIYDEFQEQVGAPLVNAAGEVIGQKTAQFVWDNFGRNRLLVAVSLADTALNDEDALNVLEEGLLVTAKKDGWVEPLLYKSYAKEYCLPSSNVKNSNIGRYKAYDNIKAVKKACDENNDCVGFTHNKDKNKFILKNKIDGAYGPKKGNFDCYEQDAPHKSFDEWWAHHKAEEKKKTDEKHKWLGSQWQNKDQKEGKEKPDGNWTCSPKTRARSMNMSDDAGAQEFEEGRVSIHLKNMTRKGCADACKNKKYPFQEGMPDTECKSLDYNTSNKDFTSQYTCRLFEGRRHIEPSDAGKATGWTLCKKNYGFTDNAYCKADGPAAVWENGNMTGSLSISVTEAKKKCDLDNTCKGFTVEKNSGKIILKNKIDGSNKKSNYSCFVK